MLIGKLRKLLNPDIGPNHDEILRRYWRKSIEGPNVVGQFFWAYLLSILLLWSFWVGPINYVIMFGYLAILLAADIYNLSIGIETKGQTDHEIDAERTSYRLGIYWVFRISSISFMLLTYGYIEGNTGRQLLLLVFPLVTAHNPGRDSVYWRQVVTDLFSYAPMLVVFLLDTGLQGWPSLLALMSALSITLIVRRGMYFELCASIDNEVTAQKLAGDLERQNVKLDEARGEAAAASRAKTRFLAAASHDLRQPVQAAFLFAELLKDSGDKKNRELVSNLRQAMQSVSDLLGKLLDVSKLDAGIVRAEVTPTSLENIITSVIGEISVTDEPLPHIGWVPSSAWVLSDPVLLQSMVQNLVMNAVRHSQADRILIGVRRSGDCAILQIIDNGIGIEKTEQQRIFDEFHQLSIESNAKSKGLGLGLSIVKRVAGLLGHEINLSSDIGKGTMFCIVLPLNKAVKSSVAPPEPSSELVGLGAILIDDNDQVRTALHATLRTWDMIVYAGDGSIAPNEFCERIDPDEIDVIVIDHNLATARTGLGYANEIAGCLRRDIPIVIISGDIGRGELEQFDKSATHFLSKPVSAEKLRITLQKINLDRAET